MILEYFLMKNRAFIFKIMHSIIIFLYNLTIYSNKISFLCKEKSKELKSLLYNPGYTPGPIGNPITYQHIIISNHTKLIAKKYGSTAL